MCTRRYLIGLSLLLVMLFLPTSAAAASGTENACTPLGAALGQFFKWVSAFLHGAPDGELGHGIDPWGRAGESPNDGDIGTGWDPWGSPAPSSGTDDGDIGPLWDPWG